MTDARILVGDCREQLANIETGTIDAIITDPPYELGFMGKTWDASGVAYDPATWAECLRVLKPGGHLCAFGGTRTYHRMTVAIEDAGFEIRDSIHWIYGSGFPKSLDVSKAIDKQRHDRADIYRVTAWVRSARDAAGIGNRQIDDAFGFSGMAGHWTSAATQPAIPTLEQIPTLLDVLGVTLDDVPDDIRQLIWTLNGRKGQPGENWGKREVIGTRKSGIANPDEDRRHTIGASTAVVIDVTAPASTAARVWHGWGTALKPAHEPIVLARKPLIGTVANNVLEHGTGALNIDGTRIENVGAPIARVTGKGTLGGTSDGYDRPWKNDPDAVAARQKRADNAIEKANTIGRWPANILITHHHACTPIGTTSDTYGGGRHATSGFASGYAHDGFAATTTPVTVYDCHPDCPAAILDAQSGTLTSGANPTRRGADTTRTAYGTFTGQGDAQPKRGKDSGGASRFFSQTNWDPDADVASFRYAAKPSKRERNAGLDHLVGRAFNVGDERPSGTFNERLGSSAPAVVANVHPTVKPVALIRWLIRLVTPPGGTILDPFLGSGTTAVAATLEGHPWTGCELTVDYLPIIEGRVAWAERHDDTATPNVPTGNATTTTATPLTLFDTAGTATS